MIKLTVTFSSTSSSYSFTKKVITIGSGSSAEVDLSLKESGIQAIHLKIIEEDGLFLLINCANDPFVSLNSTPFGKKILCRGDTVQVANTSIVIETLSLTELDKPQAPQVATKKEDFPLLDVENELSSLEYQVDEATLGEELDIKSLMDEIKQFVEPEEADETPQKVEPLPQQNKAVQERTPQREEEKESKRAAEKKHVGLHAGKSGSWRLLLTVLFSCITLVLVCAAIVYVNLSDKTENEEMTAAKGVADVAMALTYAQVNRINPQMQNWSDPKFLRTNFAAIVPPDAPFLANIDSHGHFNDCPYILRIYTSKDFSRFLVIALPAPSVLQWLIPKNALIVDSQTMELRKLQDLRALNRLLVHPNTLEGSNGMEISASVKQGQLLQLRTLASKSDNLDFAPPKTLASIRSGAENYIYNAPRYHQFGEMYAQRAINLTKASERGSHELMRLQEEMQEVAKLPHLVIYSSQGMEAAAQAKRAIKTFVPQAKFLNAYIIYNKQGGIASSSLLIDEDVSDEHVAMIIPHSLHPEISEILAQKDMHENHPLQLQLSALSTKRKQALEPLANQLTILLKAHTAEYEESFAETFSALVDEYHFIDQKEKHAIKEELQTLYDNYASMPLAQVLPYLKKAGLGQLAPSHETGKEPRFTSIQFENLLLAIQRAKSFAELAEAAGNASVSLQIKYVPEAETLIQYQNKARLEVTKTLDAFLLSPGVHLPDEEFSTEARKLLLTIFEKSWITDHEEQRFYLNEFDALSTDCPRQME